MVSFQDLAVFPEYNTVSPVLLPLMAVPFQTDGSRESVCVQKGKIDAICCFAFKSSMCF